MNNRAFTIIELVFVIAIISILSVVLIPKMTEGFDSSKQNIIDIYNGQKVCVIDMDTNEVIYEGNKESLNLTDYILVDVTYSGSIVTMYVKTKQSLVE